MLDVCFFRIDSRLLHGQVVTTWAKSVKAERILVVSDAVSKDAFRKTLILQAAPAGVKVNVLPLAKAIRLNIDFRFNGMKVFILVENIHDARLLVQGGLRAKEINIGALSFANGKKMVTDTISLDELDLYDLVWMHQRGISFDTRKVVSDSKKDLWKILTDQKIINQN